MKDTVQQFKEFLLQGNITELIIGFTVGIAFKDSISAFVDYILMPPIGYIIGNSSFENLYIVLGSTQEFSSFTQANDSGLPIIQYGAFISSLIDLLIIALSVFVVLRLFQRFGFLPQKQQQD